MRVDWEDRHVMPITHAGTAFVTDERHACKLIAKPVPWPCLAAAV